MGFLDKVKNMFTEEIEEDEVKVEKVDKVKKEIIASFNEPSVEDIEEEKKLDEEVKKPVFFDDDEFSDINSSDNTFRTREENTGNRERMFWKRSTINIRLDKTSK